MRSTGQQTINKHWETQANLSYFTRLLGWGSHVRFGGGSTPQRLPPSTQTVLESLSPLDFPKSIAFWVGWGQGEESTIFHVSPTILEVLLGCPVWLILPLLWAPCSWISTRKLDPKQFSLVLTHHIAVAFVGMTWPHSNLISTVLSLQFIPLPHIHSLLFSSRYWFHPESVLEGEDVSCIRIE